MNVELKDLSAGENKLDLTANKGVVEAILHLPEENQENPDAILICCHPHPLYGGTMTNKVVHTVCKMVSRLGIPALRFNFRGVGASEGAHDEGHGESEDLLKLCEWMKTLWPEQRLFLAGFSFGSWVAAHSAKAAEASHLLSIAPPVQHFDFDKFARPDCPWAVIMGEEDEVVSPDSVFNWIENQNNPPELIRYPETGHFFHGKIYKLGQTIDNIYSDIL